MAKELPFFRFTVAEWLNDDISLYSYHLQGVFASVCAFYWFQDCSIAKAKLNLRFRDATDDIQSLIDLNIIKEDDDGFISIRFLDEQFDLLSEKRQKRVEAGRKGGLSKSSNAKAMLKQSSSYKDKYKYKDKDKDKEYIPTLPEVLEYFEENGYDPSTGEKAYEIYNASLEDHPTRKYWRDSRDNPIKNWKMKMRSVWFKPENVKGQKNGNNQARTKGDEHVDFLNYLASKSSPPVQ